MGQELNDDIVLEDLRYLQLLSRSFPTIAAASTEIINLEAIQNLPKGTEHFLADLHGEYEAFQHVLKNASGAIKRKVKEIFGDTLGQKDQKEICTLIYYPEQKLEIVKRETDDIDDWYFVTINRLVLITRNVSSKYSRSKVRKALPDDFSYIIQELLHETAVEPNKQAYVDVIVKTIISTDRADDFIIAMSKLIQRLVIDRLHILGDVFDRGPSPDKIMDILCEYHDFDIQWGNHDILWMGAASGNDCCIANVIRIAMRYANQSVLEDGYGINILPLATFAMDTYADDECAQFMPKVYNGSHPYSDKTLKLISQMHKAISVIQFKLEANTIKKHPEFEMENRLLLHKMDLDNGTVILDGKEYELTDTNFPTIDPNDPYKLTHEELELVTKLHNTFKTSEKLKRHMICLFRNGCIYKIANSNLLYHASIPLNNNGSLKEIMINGKGYKGKKLLKKVGALIREAYFGDKHDTHYKFALDYIWYLWCGKNSPLFDKDKMATFEGYFIKEKEARKELKGAYYKLRNNEEICDMILDEFGVTGTHRHIINGHVPVKATQGESPIRANGKMMVIDGGFSKAYQPETGIAGYTLVYHSRGFQLVQHEPFTSITEAVEGGLDIKSTTQIVEMNLQRMMVKDTDIGKELRCQIDDLKKLLYAYHSGLIKEKEPKPIYNK